MNKEQSETKELRPFGLVSDVHDVVEAFAVCAVSIMLIFIFLFTLTIVDGSSMERTLHEGEYLLVSKVAYMPKKGDIIIVHDTSLSKEYAKPLVKRVIAVEGDTISFDFTDKRNWKLYVNGDEVDQSYAYFDPNSYVLTPDWNIPETIPEGKIFVMGDNRNNSADSRVGSIGLIDNRCVIGRAVMRVSPLSNIGSLIGK